MTFSNVGIAAAHGKDDDLLAAFFAARIIYALEDNEDPQGFIALDTPSGSVQPALSWHNAIWWLDPLDATTPHDGISTLVSSDGYRYKSATVNVDIFSALSQTVSSPPDTNSPPDAAIGDVYLVPAGSSGAWSSHADDIAVYTSRGWEYIPPAIGRWLHIEDEDRFVRYDSAGAWVVGQGGRTFDVNSVPISAIINGAKFFIVENQTTNTPPSLPDVPVAYIVGSSPTGVWLGKAGQIAVCEVDNVWTFYVPAEGWEAYDKATHSPYRYSGSAWLTGGGNMQLVRHVYTSGVSTFTHDARCVMVDVTVIGGGGGAGTSSSAGGTSSFGSHNSATGGAASALSASSHMAGASGVGSGGDRNGSGVPGFAVFDGSATNNSVGSAGVLHTEFGAFWGGTILDVGSNAQIGGPPGISRKILLVAALLANETVTVGAAGSNASVSSTFLSPQAGMVVVDEWVLT